MNAELLNKFRTTQEIKNYWMNYWMLIILLLKISWLYLRYIIREFMLSFGLHWIKHWYFTLLAGVENLWKRTVPKELRENWKSPETMQKLCLSNKVLHQKIRWNYNIIILSILHCFYHKLEEWIIDTFKQMS